MEYLIGIDDAGRGPVMGPMLMAGILISADKQNELKLAGAKDSKLLSAQQRERILAEIKVITKDYKFKIVTPHEIDTGFGSGLNLNQVEALTAASIINEFVEGLSIAQKSNLKIILDCPSINTEGWKLQLLSYVKEKNLASKILCEHKADYNYPVVSAASILAKVTRDAEIEKIKDIVGEDFGSGYPSDPTTIEFLKKHVDNPKLKGFFRESWATFRQAKIEKQIQKDRQAKLF